MKNFTGEIIIRPKNIDKHTIEAIGMNLHQQLVGNKDYINSNIGINLSEKEILVWFDNCEEEIPNIIF